MSRHSRNTIRFMLVLPLALLTAVEAQASSCAAIADSEERLSCYDRLAECVVTHEPRARLACYDAVQTSEVRRGEGSAPLAARIAEVKEGARGLRYLTLDNGQVWRELTRSRIEFEPGARVDLRSGILGSVNLRVEGRDGHVKVRRVE